MPNTRSLKGRVWDFLSNGLWTEALRLFFYYWRGWIKGFVGFSIAFILINYASEQISNSLVLLTLNLLSHLTLIYFFIACFLYQEPLTKVTNPSIGQFLRVTLFLGVIAVGLIALKAILYLGIGELIARTPATDWGAIPLAIKVVISAINIWIFVRLLFVGPLAASEASFPFKKSWNLTRGKFMRLLGNWIMLGLMTLPFFFAEKQTMPILNGLADVFETGLYAAYICVACRILNGEYIAAHLGQDRRTVSRS